MCVVIGVAVTKYIAVDVEAVLSYSRALWLRIRREQPGTQAERMATYTVSCNRHKCRYSMESAC
jgi:hypothetical protein